MIKAQNKKYLYYLIMAIILTVTALIIYLPTIYHYQKIDKFSEDYIYSGLVAILVPAIIYILKFAFNIKYLPNKIFTYLTAFMAFTSVTGVLTAIGLSTKCVYLTVSMAALSLVYTFAYVIKIFIDNMPGSQWVLPLQIANIIYATVLLIKYIPNGSDGNTQMIVATIIAAVYGGVITLTGVAWTIKNNERTRREDFNRAREENFSVEKKKSKPIFDMTAYFDYHDYDNFKNIVIPHPVAGGKSLELINSDNSNFKIKAVYINNKWNYLTQNNYVFKGQTVILNFRVKKLDDKFFDKGYYICIEDILGNEYYYNIKYLKDTESGEIDEDTVQVQLISENEIPKEDQ